MNERRVWLRACFSSAPCLLAAVAATAQQVVDLPGEDRWLEPRFEEVYRLGSPGGADWE